MGRIGAGIAFAAIYILSMAPVSAQGLFSFGISSKDLQPSLIFKGLVKTKDDFLSQSTVEVFVDSVRFLTKITNHSGKFQMQLPLNKEFIVKFSNDGYVSKTVKISTKVPAHRKDVYKFKFTMDLFEVVEGLDVSILDNPVAIITFNNLMNKFDYDYNYTVLVNEDIEHLYAEYYKLSK